MPAISNDNTYFQFQRDLDLQAIQESDHFLKKTATKDEAGDAIVEQTIEFPVVWDAITIMWRHCLISPRPKITSTIETMTKHFLDEIISSLTIIIEYKSIDLRGLSDYSTARA